MILPPGRHLELLFLLRACFRNNHLGNFDFPALNCVQWYFHSFAHKSPNRWYFPHFPTHFLVFTLILTGQGRGMPVICCQSVGPSMGLLQESEDCWSRENLSAAISTCSLQLSQFSFLNSSHWLNHYFGNLLEVFFFFLWPPKQIPGSKTKQIQTTPSLSLV